jgi:hypothetical protein
VGLWLRQALSGAENNSRIHVVRLTSLSLIEHCRLKYLDASLPKPWTEEAESTAVAGHRRVWEDGPEMCSSESAAEYSEHGEEYSDSDMCRPDMLDDYGKPVLGRATMTM